MNTVYHYLYLLIVSYLYLINRRNIMCRLITRSQQQLWSSTVDRDTGSHRYWKWLYWQSHNKRVAAVITVKKKKDDRPIWTVMKHQSTLLLLPALCGYSSKTINSFMLLYSTNDCQWKMESLFELSYIPCHSCHLKRVSCSLSESAEQTVSSYVLHAVSARVCMCQHRRVRLISKRPLWWRV